MKTLTILPAIVLGAASFALSTSVVAASSGNPITGTINAAANATGHVLKGATQVGVGTGNVVVGAGKTTVRAVGAVGKTTVRTTGRVLTSTGHALTGRSR